MQYKPTHFESIDSTNEEAKRRIAAGLVLALDEALVLTADAQTGGYGRRGRAWASPVGNLYCTIITPLVGDRAKVGEQAYIYGLAIAEAANEVLAAPHAKVKWPNDVLVNGKKLCGILLETAGDCLIAGFGVNVATTPDAAPDALFAPTSLADYGVQITAQEFLPKVLACLDRLQHQYSVNGFGTVREIWCSMAHGMGETINVNLPDGTRLQGRFADLDSSGALVLETDGARRLITAGDVFFASKVA